MSLMAELGQGPAPGPGAFTAGSTGARPQIHQHQSRVIACPPVSDVDVDTCFYK